MVNITSNMLLGVSYVYQIETRYQELHHVSAVFAGHIHVQGVGGGRKRSLNGMFADKFYNLSRQHTTDDAVVPNQPQKDKQQKNTTVTGLFILAEQLNKTKEKITQAYIRLKVFTCVC